MARGGVEFEGIGAAYATFKAAAALQNLVATNGVVAVEGKAVTLTGNGEVGFGVDGDRLFGKILKYEDDGYVTVQYSGFTELPGVADLLPVAGDSLVVNGSGAVKAKDAAAPLNGPACAVSVDATQNTVMVYLG